MDFLDSRVARWLGVIYCKAESGHAIADFPGPNPAVTRDDLFRDNGQCNRNYSISSDYWSETRDLSLNIG